MNINQYQRLVIGSSRKGFTRGIVSAIGLVVVIYTTMLVLRSFPSGIPIGTPLLILLSILATGTAAMYSYIHNGLLPSILLATAPFMGWTLAQATAVSAYPSFPNGLSLLQRTGQASLLFGVPLGFLGFVIGITISYISGS